MPRWGRDFSVVDWYNLPPIQSQAERQTRQEIFVYETLVKLILKAGGTYHAVSYYGRIRTPWGTTVDERLYPVPMEEMMRAAGAVRDWYKIPT